MSGTNDPRLTQANFAWGASSDPPISSFRPAAPGGFGSQWSTMSGSQQSTPFPSPSSTHASQQLAVVTTPSASDMNANNGTSVQDTIQGSQVTKKERESEVKCEELMLFLKQGPYSDIEAGVYSDFKVKCQDKIFKLHRVVVCPHSPWILQQLEQNRLSRAKVQDPIEFVRERPYVFELFIQLMYLGDLDPSTTTTLLPIDYARLYIVTEFHGSEAICQRALELAKPQMAAICRRFRSCDPDPSKIGGRSSWDDFAKIVNHLYWHKSSDKAGTLLDHIAYEAALNWRFLKLDEIVAREFPRKLPEFTSKLLSKMAPFASGFVDERGMKRTADEAFGGSDGN